MSSAPRRRRRPGAPHWCQPGQAAASVRAGRSSSRMSVPGDRNLFHGCTPCPYGAPIIRRRSGTGGEGKWEPRTMPRSAARAVPGDHGARARRVQHCLPLPAAFERQRSVRPSRARPTRVLRAFTRALQAPSTIPRTSTGEVVAFAAASPRAECSLFRPF